MEKKRKWNSQKKRMLMHSFSFSFRLLALRYCYGVILIHFEKKKEFLEGIWRNSETSLPVVAPVFI